MAVHSPGPQLRQLLVDPQGVLTMSDFVKIIEAASRRSHLSHAGQLRAIRADFKRARMVRLGTPSTTLEASQRVGLAELS